MDNETKKMIEAMAEAYDKDPIARAWLEGLTAGQSMPKPSKEAEA